jgi:hypothetical protein
MAVNPKSVANLIPFKTGETGNPGGKPKASRNRIQGAFLGALADDFDEFGKQAIVDAREKDPMGYVKAIVALMPKQFEQSTPMEDLTDAEIVAGIALLRSQLASGSREGASQAPVSESLN